MGASILILANKRDLPNCISLQDIEKVISACRVVNSGIIFEFDSDSPVNDFRLQCNHRRKRARGNVVVSSRYRG